jgi:hypothetical protein
LWVGKSKNPARTNQPQPTTRTPMEKTTRLTQEQRENLVAYLDG